MLLSFWAIQPCPPQQVATVLLLLAMLRAHAPQKDTLRKSCLLAPMPIRPFLRRTLQHTLLRQWRSKRMKTHVQVSGSWTSSAARNGADHRQANTFEESHSFSFTSRTPLQPQCGLQHLHLHLRGHQRFFRQLGLQGSQLGRALLPPSHELLGLSPSICAAVQNWSWDGRIEARL